MMRSTGPFWTRTVGHMTSRRPNSSSDLSPSIENAQLQKERQADNWAFRNLLLLAREGFGDPAEPSLWTRQSRVARSSRGVRNANQLDNHAPIWRIAGDPSWPGLNARGGVRRPVKIVQLHLAQHVMPGVSAPYRDSGLRAEGAFKGVVFISKSALLVARATDLPTV
jgi:hypothetical protein